MNESSPKPGSRPPAAAAPSVGTAPGSQLPAGRAGNGRRVLVVDDEEPLARLVGNYLVRDGFEVAVSLDGLEVCRRLRAFSDCYLIMLTARSDEVDKLIGLSVGADDYLTKPFSPRELVARVHVMLRRPRGGTAARRPAEGWRHRRCASAT